MKTIRDYTILDYNKNVSTRESYDLNILFDLSEDVLCIINSSGFIERANQKFLAISGRSSLETAGLRFESLIHPEDRDSIIQELFNATPGQIEEFTARIDKDHSGKNFLWRSKLAEGKLYLTAKTIVRVNATEIQAVRSHQNPVKLIASQINPPQLQILKPIKSSYTNNVEHRFHALVKNGTDLLAILNEEGIYQYVSPTSKGILGMAPEYYIGKNAFEFIHPDDVAITAPLFAKILGNFKVDIPPYRFINSDGKWCWLETVITNLLDDPAINGIVCNSRDITLQIEMENDILRNSRRFNNLVEHNNDGSFTLSRDWKFVSLNAIVRNSKKLPADLKIGANFWKIFSNELNTPFFTEFNRAFKENVPVNFKEFSPLFNRWFEINAYPFDDSLTVMIRDITKQKIQQLTLSLEKEVLEMSISVQFSLKEIVDRLLIGLERIYPGMICSVLKLNSKGTQVFHLSAPSMPSDFINAINGLEIGPQAGSCGSAAFLKKTVIVSDIETHPFWTSYKELVFPLGFKSCWSFPVINSKQRVLATFGIYHKVIKAPTEDETKALARAGTILQILIENSNNRKELERSNERYRLTIQATSDSIWDYNIAKSQVYRGNGFGKFYNQEQGLECLSQKKWEHNIHPEDAARVEKSLGSCLLNADANYWTEEYRYLKKDKTYASVIDKGYIVRNSEKKAIRVVGALQDITEIKKSQDQLKQSQENYKSMFTYNPTPMWTYDLETHCFTMVNDAALELYGYTRNEFLMLDLFSIRIKEEHEKLREMLKVFELQQSGKFTNEWTHLKKNGSKIIVDVVSHPVLIYGRRSRLVAIHDITEKKKAGQEILDQNQRLMEIAQISSHETRKPLASILGLVSIFDKKNPGNPLNNEIIQYLEISASELDKVIHSIVKKTCEEASASPETDASN